jgi:hypothetical protein
MVGVNGIIAVVRGRATELVAGSSKFGGLAANALTAVGLVPGLITAASALALPIAVSAGLVARTGTRCIDDGNFDARALAIHLGPAEVGRLYRECYHGFTAKHFHEHLVQSHSFRWSCSWTKTYLRTAATFRRRPRRGAHRSKRPRKALPGMMLHQDGSRHHWIRLDHNVSPDMMPTAAC